MKSFNINIVRACLNLGIVGDSSLVMNIWGGFGELSYLGP